MKRGNITVLYIEDNPIDAELFIKSLESIEGNKISIIVAEDLTTAHEVGDCDVILLDLHLVESIGTDTVEKCRKGYPQKPIVVLTKIKDPITQADCMKAGANYYFCKGEQDLAVIHRAIEAAVVGHMNRMALEEEVNVTQKYVSKHEETLTIVRDRLTELLRRL